MAPPEVIEDVLKSGLRGRGGAAFPAAMKWRFLAGAPGPTKYILCNAEEGDPGAYNDKGLLEKRSSHRTGRDDHRRLCDRRQQGICLHSVRTPGRYPYHPDGDLTRPTGTGCLERTSWAAASTLI